MAEIKARSSSQQNGGVADRLTSSQQHNHSKDTLESTEQFPSLPFREIEHMLHTYDRIQQQIRVMKAQLNAAAQTLEDDLDDPEVLLNNLTDLTREAKNESSKFSNCQLVMRRAQLSHVLYTTLFPYSSNQHSGTENMQGVSITEQEREKLETLLESRKNISDKQLLQIDARISKETELLYLQQELKEKQQQNLQLMQELKSEHTEEEEPEDVQRLQSAIDKKLEKVKVLKPLIHKLMIASQKDIAVNPRLLDILLKSGKPLKLD